MTDFALFVSDGDLLVPQDIARSLWKADQMHGVATSGALGREVERAVAAAGRDDLRPARYTVDLFRAPSMGPCRTESAVVREGTRLMLVDAMLIQDDRPVARASALFLRESESPGGAVWTPADVLAPPPLELAPVSEEPRVPVFSSDGAWSQTFADHQNAGRKQTWQTALPIVAGERPTPFQGLAGMADSTSMLVNWGDQGVQYINTDISVSIARLPTGQEMGLSTLSRYEYDGIATGTAVIFDRQGPLGTSTVTSLANARRAVDFTEHDFTARSMPGA